MTVTGRKMTGAKSDIVLLGLSALPLVMLVGLYVAYFGYMDYVPQIGDDRSFGFGHGLLNGYFAVPTLVVSLFNDSWAVYAPVNNGNGYAAGFLFGLVLAFAGARRLKSKR